MKYITKKEMLTSSRVVPVGTVIEKHSSGFYRLIIDYPLTVSLAPEFVENAPDYFEPVQEQVWTDDDMIDFGLLVEHAVFIKRISKTMDDHFKAFIAYKGLKR